MITHLRAALAIERQSKSRKHVRQTGDDYKLMLACWTGRRNTGADVRVHEIVRQLLRIFPRDFSVTVNVSGKHPRNYFAGAKKFLSPDASAAERNAAVSEQFAAHDAVMACEGSLFMSAWSDQLALSMIRHLALAARQDRLAVAYGAEAGQMTPQLKMVCRRYLRGVEILTRNETSTRTLAKLGIDARSATDTAWTFAPSPAESARELLLSMGWDGQQPLVIFCPIDPFYFPIRFSLSMYMENRVTGRHQSRMFPGAQPRGFFFSAAAPLGEKTQNYVLALAKVADEVRKQGAFPVIVGMDHGDTPVCKLLAEKIHAGAPTVLATDHDGFLIVSVLRLASSLISSRLHAVITSAGAMVPTVGVTFDDRIPNVLGDRDQQHLCLSVAEENLADEILSRLEEIGRSRDAVRDQIGRYVAKQIRIQADMGRRLEELVCEKAPALACSADRPWEHYLPQLDPVVEALLLDFDSSG